MCECIVLIFFFLTLGTVWIDAICINQGDIPERSSQVNAMHLVYSFAKSVVVWLGPSDSYSKIAMDFAAKLDGASFLREYEVHNKTSKEVLEEIPDKTYIFDPEINLEMNLSREVITSLVNFICRPWFSRVWVLQEAAGCQEIRVLCGEDQIPWDQLFSIAWIMRSDTPGMLPSYLPDSFSLVQRKVLAVLRMHKIRLYRFPKGDRADHRRPILSNILDTAALHEATDPRDKIYSAANLSMSRDKIMDLDFFFRQDAEDWNLKADYTIPWEILYAQVSLELLRRGYLSFLVDSGRYKQPAAWGGMPSWVVNFHEQPSNTEIPENTEWMAGGRLRNPIGISNPQSVVKLGTLPKAQRRIIDTSLMSKEFQTCDRSRKSCLNSFVGLQIVMRDEIVWISKNEVDSDANNNHEPTSSSVNKSQRILHSIDQELSKAMEAPAIRGGLYLNGESLSSAYKLTIILGMDHKSNRVAVDFVDKEWDPFISWLQAPDPEVEDYDNLPPYVRAKAASSVWDEMRFAITAHGYFCLVPAIASAGDSIVVVRHHHMPLVLRPYKPPSRNTSTTSDEYFESIGSGYVHGMMQNEAKCIIDEFGYKANMDETRRKNLEEKRAKSGDVWEELGFGDYRGVLETIGPAWVNIV